MIVLARYRRWKSLFVALMVTSIATVFIYYAPMWALAEQATGRGSAWIRLAGAIPGIVYFTYAMATLMLCYALRLAWFGLTNCPALAASSEGLHFYTFKGSQVIAWRSLVRITLKSYTTPMGRTTDPELVAHYIDDANGGTRTRGVMVDVLAIGVGSAEALLNQIESLSCAQWGQNPAPPLELSSAPSPVRAGFGRKGL